MDRRLAVFAVVGLAGCSGFRDAFTGHQDVVARAAGQQLTVEQLAIMIAPAQQIPLRRDVIDRLADLWVDYQLLARAVSSGDSLMDSATVLGANWPVVAQRLANHLHDTLIVSRAMVSGAQVDSAYNGNDYRYISHILVQVGSADTAAAAKAVKRRRAEGFLAQIRRGDDFARLASQVSDDPGSKNAGGSLGLIGRGATVKPFEDAAFALQPGQVSDVVESNFGYHVIWRPRLDAIRDSFTARVREVMITQLDSVYLDSLATKTDIRVRGSAPSIVRSAVQDLRAAKRRSRLLATYRGGRLREKDFVRWLQAYPPQTAGMVLQAPDTTLIEFVKSIARNEMLMRSAEQRGIKLSRADQDSIFIQWRNQLGIMLTQMGIAPDSLAADSTGGDRATKAARRTDAYFTTITNTQNQRMFFDVPPYLADMLRDRYAWSISSAGVDRALERARAVRGPEAPQGQGPARPAPLQMPPGAAPGARPATPRPSAPPARRNP